MLACSANREMKIHQSLRQSKKTKIPLNNRKFQKMTSKFRIPVKKLNQINNSLRNKLIPECLIQERPSLVACNALDLSLSNLFLLSLAPRLVKALPL